MEPESVVSFVDRIRREIERGRPVCVRGEAVDVRTTASGTYAMTIIGGRDTRILLDDLAGIRAYTTTASRLDSAVRSRLNRLAIVTRRPALGRRGVEATGRLRWDPARFGPSLCIDRLAISDVSAIQNVLNSVFVGAVRSAHNLPRWPRRIAFLGREGTEAFHDLRGGASPQRIKIEAIGVSMMGPGMVADAVEALCSLTPHEYDAVVIARGGGGEADLLPFSDPRLAQAVEQCAVPVLVAIGHVRDRPLVERYTNLAADTPLAAGRLLGAKLSETRRNLEQLRDDCSNRKDQAVKRLEARRLTLMETLDDEYARARRRLNRTHRRWVASMIALSGAAAAFAWFSNRLLAATAVVACVAACSPALAARAERRRVASAPPAQQIVELEHAEPEGFGALRSLRWSRSMVDELHGEMSALIRQLEPTLQPSDDSRHSHIEEQLTMVEDLARRRDASDLQIAVTMDRAIRLADDLLQRPP
jgi:exonuclease VII large subunit